MSINSKDYRRKIITFCGSTEFTDLFHKLASDYTLMGYIVLMPHCYLENQNRDDLKDLLINIHRDMIAMSDVVLVINPYRYIGESTFEQIKFASALGKEIKYYKLPEDAINNECVTGGNDEK